MTSTKARASTALTGMMWMPGALTTTAVHPEDAAPEKYLANACGFVTRRHDSPLGCLVVQTPTFRLTTDALNSVETAMIGRVILPSGEHFRFAEAPALVSFSVTGGGSATAVSMKALPGLLTSTDAAFGIGPVVQSKFMEATAFAEQEWFEDGIESALSRTLSMLLHTYGDAVVTAAEVFLISPMSNTEIAVETAQWLGAVDHPASTYYRKTILEHLLSAPSTRIRHGAAMGLAALNDPATLFATRRARDREGNRRLRTYFDLVVDQLERTRACHNS